MEKKAKKKSSKVKEETRRLSTEEVNRKSKPKKANSMGETQIVGRISDKDGISGRRDKTSNKKDKKKKKKFRDKHPAIATIIKLFFILLILFIIIAAAIFFGALWGGFNFFDLLGDDFKISKEELVVRSENSIIYDSEGNVLANLSDGEQRTSVKLDEMSKYLPKAYVAIEDERFYEHSGVDFKRTGAATINYIIHRGKSSFGGSSITQQVVKNLTQEKEDTAMRKVKEMVKALQVEHMLSKDQILELYLNLIFVGGQDINGVGLGAVYYFNKDVKDLSLAECAYMAAINNSPNSYNPFGEDGDKKQDRIDKGQKRAKVVLNKMKELGYITDKELKDAKAEIDAGLNFSNGNTTITTLVSYQTDAAISQIIKQYAEENGGLSTAEAKRRLFSSGYSIYTTQRSSIQHRTEEEMEKEYYHLVSTGENAGQNSMCAITVIDPKTGEVVCMGAGIGADKSHTYIGYYNYCTDMLKQTGSSIKPIAVLAAGLNNNKLTASTAFFDGPTTFPGVYNKNGTLKVFKNEGAYHYRIMTLREAIAISQNIPNLKGIMTVGINESADFCVTMGILDADKSRGVTLALGALTNGASTLQMAAAYAAISNNGVYIEPIFYTKVVDSKGNIVMQPKSVEERSRRVLSEANAYIVKRVMQGAVMPGGTASGYGAIANMDVSAKTGTTNDNYDRWYVTFTNYYASACWFGYEFNSEVHWDNKGTWNPAGEMTANVMQFAHKDLPESRYVEPAGISHRTICRASGMSAAPGCTDVYDEIFVTGTEPGPCNVHGTVVRICDETGMLASQWCQHAHDEVRSTLPDSEINGRWTTDYMGYGVIPTQVCPHTPESYQYND